MNVPDFTVYVAVCKRDARRAVRRRLDLIALVQRGAEIRVHPLYGINLLYLDFSVEVDELRLRLRNGHRIAFAVTDRFIQFVVRRGV